MNFLHIKIFAHDLDAERITQNVGIVPDFVYKADGVDPNGKKDAWMYTEETCDEEIDVSIASMIERLYEKKDFFIKLSREVPSAELYFVIAHYVSSYQRIVYLDNDAVTKLAEMGFRLTIDIMSP